MENEQNTTGNSQRLKLGVLGVQGRVSQLIVREIRQHPEHPDFILQGATVAPGSPAAGQDISGLCGLPPFGLRATDDVETVFNACDVLIDFTLPDATMNHIALAGRTGKALVIGTTGLTEDHENALMEAGKTATIVRAPNMSVGVNLLMALVKKAAAALGPEFDIEIFESHHRNKIDAPSGTALALGQAAAAGRNVDLNEQAAWARHGNTGRRETGTIGFSVQRGGDIVGEHTASFLGTGERLELTHRATDRALFARGALHAAKWAAACPDNGLFSMQDVIEIRQSPEVMNTKVVKMQPIEKQ